MRILICTSELPLPPITGTRLALLETLEHLKRWHDVTVVGVRWPEQAEGTIPGVRTREVQRRPQRRIDRVRAYGRASRHGLPLQTIGLEALIGPQLDEALRQDGPFDVVHVTGPALASVARRLGTTPKVLAALDAWHLNARSQTTEAARWLRPLRRLEERRIERFQRSTFDLYDAVVTVSEEDAGELRQLGVSTHIGVVPNGVDAERFSPGSVERPATPLIVFVGTMRWSPNIRAATHLALEVLPRVRQVHPDARLAIVGRYVSDATRAELERSPGVEVTGEVDDVVEWYRAASVVAVPMLDGTGIKNKVLEAMACAAPVIATPLALQGLRPEAHEACVVRPPGEAFAEGVVELLDDPVGASERGRAARRYVERFHDWAAATRELVAIYDHARSSPG